MAEDKPASILTGSQRAFLREGGETDNAAHDRALRSRIRARLRAGFDDLRLLLNAEAEREVNNSSDLGKVLADLDAGRVWPLPALLFMWSLEHPQLSGVDDMADVLTSGDESTTLEAQMDRFTDSFDTQVESGVRAVLEFSDFEQVPKEVSNELTVSLGGPVSDMTDDDLAQLPRRTLDSLFRRGDLDNSEYARVMQLKLKSEE